MASRVVSPFSPTEVQALREMAANPGGPAQEVIDDLQDQIDALAAIVNQLQNPANNARPVVSAGTDQTVYEGETVYLTASASDEDGTITAYQWTQLSGPAVTINNPNTASASFTAPLVTGSTAFVFNVAVTDNDSAVSSDSVTVNVVDALQAPVNVIPPSVAGSPNVGQTLTANPGTWAANPAATFAYQWRERIAGVVSDLENVTSQTFTVEEGDEGRELGFVVTANNSQGTETAESPFVTIVAPGTIETAFDSLYDPGFTLDSATDAVTQAALTRPAKSATIASGGYVDPQFGTQVRRTTEVTDIVDTNPAYAVSAMRHEYSRRQAWNADNTRFIAQAGNGWWHLYDANTLERLDGGRPIEPGLGAIRFTTPSTPNGHGGDCEPIWHPTDPSKLWYTRTSGGLIWYERDVGTGVNTVLFDMTAAVQALYPNANRAWFKGEGRPSDDGDVWAFMVETEANQIQAIVMYRRSTNTILWHIPLSSNRPDHISTSPLGTHAVVSWYGSAAGSLADEAARPITGAAGVRAYDSASTFKVLTVLGEHSDCALDAEGNEVFVMVSFHGQADGVTDGGIMVRRIDDPAQAYTLPINAFGGSTGTGFHISGCATKRRGWALISKYSGVGVGPYDGQVFAAELVPNNPRVLRLAHHRSTVGNYFAEPHATVNRDFTRVVFSSDFGGQVSTYEDYQILLPSWAIPVAGLAVPLNTALPEITGTAAVGFDLTVVPGTWAGVDIVLTYQWKRDGVEISGATATTYSVQAADDATTITCDETATNGAGSDTATSVGVLVSELAAPMNTVAPFISGATEVGQTLSANRGTWTGNPVPGYAYQWQLFTGGSWTDVLEADQSTFVPSAAGDYRVEVEGSNSQGSAIAYSIPVTVAEAPAAKEIVGTPIAASGTWTTAGSISKTGVTAGNGLVLALEIEEADTGDALPANMPDVLGTTWLHAGTSDPVTGKAGRLGKVSLYYCTGCQAGDAVIPFDLGPDSHYAAQLVEVVNLTALDVFNKARNATTYEASMPIDAVDEATTGNGLVVTALLTLTDMSNAQVAVPTDYTPLGLDQAGPVCGGAAYRITSAVATHAPTWNATGGGYGDGWTGAIAVFK